MRPLKIELQYFGPYEHEVVDFTQFRDQSLFLVAGNTGAGKTTIFDAMCYALFGQTTNDRDRSATALRSDFAPGDQETFVKFTFVHQNIKYQITRRPKQVLTGRAGRLIEHNQAVNLIYPLNSQTPNEITKVREADNFIADLLHLTRDQFKQIVLLPQGKFRQFLDSDSNTKETLLRDLFNTARYEQWTNQLKDNLRDYKKELQGQHTKLQSLKETIDKVDSQLPTAEWVKEVNKLNLQLNQQLQDLQTKEANQQKQIKELDNKYHKEQELITNLAVWDKVKNEKVKLGAEQHQIEAIKQQAARLEWYQNYRPDYQRWQDGEKQLQKLKQELTKLQATLTAQENTHQRSLSSFEKLNKQQPTINQLQQEVNDLTNKLPLFAECDNLSEEVTVLQGKMTRKKKLSVDKQEHLAKSQKQIEQIAVEIAQNKDLPDKRVALVKQQNDQEKLDQAVAELNELIAKKEQASKQQQELADKLAKAQNVAANDSERLADLNDLFARHQIAILAQRLKPGSPCPVCGSLDHPQPAHLQDNIEIVSEAEVKSATVKAQKSNTNVTRLQEQLNQSTDKLAELTNQINTQKKTISKSMGLGELPVDWQVQLESRAENLRQQATKLAKAEEKVHSCQQKQEKLNKAISSCQEELQRVNDEIAELNQQLITKKTLLTEKKQALPAEVTDKQIAEEQIDNYQEKVNQFNHQFKALQEQLQVNEKEIAVSKSRLEQTGDDLTSQKNKQNSLHTYLVGLLSKYDVKLSWEFWQKAEDKLSQLPALQGKITSYENQVRANHQEQERLAKLINNQSMPDISTTEKQLAEARQQANHRQQKIGQVGAERGQIQETIAKVNKIISATSDLDQDINELQTLTDVVSGNTENHVSLERYVLQAYFQDVLVAANIQLTRLTNGRYQFELATESHGAGAKWSGLEVNVYDDNAGRTRSARTLSGGESFMASLALALALCQIIQEQNGGIDIDALFIDEGFGSLDQQALDDALHALQELEGHRMIGIISHVTELEEQIPDQLLVSSKNGRSKISYQHEI